MVVILIFWVSIVQAVTVSEEARRYMARGIAAVEMAKSPGDYALAVQEFEQAARLAPDWPVIYYNLGGLQSKIGDYTSAIKSFRRYLELAPQSPDAEKVQEEIFKLEYRRDREKLATMLAGIWTDPNGHKFKLLLDGTRLQLTRDVQQGDDILNLRSMGKTYTGPMTDAPPLVFSGILVGDKISGQYLQAKGKSSGHCDMPERKGSFEGTIDVAAGQMRIVYNRVTLEYKMEFKSFLSDELVCRQTNRQETPDYVLELKKQSLPGSASVPNNTTGGYLGTTLQKMTEELAKASGLNKVKGAFVLSVNKNSPAEQAGLKSGDIILSFDGKEINEMSVLPPIVAATPAWKTVDARIYRDGKEQTVKVKIGNRQSILDSEKTSIPSPPTGAYK
jgi:tetratricopeptide (TPR) repeat protein